MTLFEFPFGELDAFTGMFSTELARKMARDALWILLCFREEGARFVAHHTDAILDGEGRRCWYTANACLATTRLSFSQLSLGVVCSCFVLFALGAL